MEITNPKSKEQVAIIVVGYNRIPAIKRLLQSLIEAQYAVENAPLVISIDGSGNQQLYDYVQQFEWPYGDKYVNIQKERLGLKNHIFQCFDYSKFFRGVILLEDDVFVSKYFYHYAICALDSYENDERIAEIALYKNEMNGYVGLPFIPMNNGSDTYLMQDVCTSGECITWRMWSEFRSWLSSHSNDDFKIIDMPDIIKNWSRAWSKAYNAFVVSNHKYVVYPHFALTTNFNDVGEHGGDDGSVTQVNLSFKDTEYQMKPFEEMVRYDIYFNNELIYDWLGIDSNQLVLDIYGYNERILKNYLLTTRELPIEKEKSFALAMRPIELNVKYRIDGNGLYLYKTEELRGKSIKGNYSNNVIPFFLDGFRNKLLVKQVSRYLLNKILKFLHLK